MSRFHRALAESMERAAEFPPGMLVTLVRAEISRDAKYANGTVSVLPESESGRALRILKSSELEIKQELNKRIRLRVTPELRWSVDRTEGEAAEVERILNDLEEMGEV
jgi:ribosome-binding factor A